MGLRAAIRAGTEIQALAMTTPSSRETFSKFREGVKQGLDARDSAFGDFLSSDKPEPQEEVVMNFRDEAVRRALDKLPERERDVVELRFGVGLAEPTPLRETGRVLGMSAERVRQLEERALRQLAESGDLDSLREAA